MAKQLIGLFKTPMVFIPKKKAKPSLSRSEIWKEELGLDADDASDDLNDSKEDLVEEQQKLDERTLIEYYAIQRELEDRNSQRDDLLFKIKTLTDKCKQYKQKLLREEFTKKQQIKILRKTRDAHLEEKQDMIRNLEELVSEQESKLEELEKQLNSSKSNRQIVVTRTPSGHTRLLEQLKRIQQEKADLTGQLVTSQAQTEYTHTELTEEINNLKQSIAAFEKEKIELQEEIIRLRNEQLGFANTDTEKALKKLEDENNQLGMEIIRYQKLQKQNSIKPEDHEDALEAKKKLHLHVDNLQSELNTKNRLLSVLERDHQHELQDLQEENRKIATNLNTMIAEISQLQSRKPEIVTKIEKVEVEVEVESEASKQALLNAQNELNQMSQRLRNLQGACVSSKNQLTKTVSHCKDLELKVSQAEEECISAEAKFQQQLHKVEAQKQATVQAIKKQAETKLMQAYTYITSVRQKFNSLAPSLQHILVEQNKLREQCQYFPKFVAAVVKETSEQISCAVSGIDDKNNDLVRKYKKEMSLRKKYHNQLIELKGNIRVFSRVRPKIREDGTGLMANNVISYDPDDNGIINVQFKGRKQVFELDQVFNERSSQTEIFNEVKPLVLSCIDGYNVCIFAYGQTGSGKTYTMEGLRSNPGINQQALSELFNETNERMTDWTYQINVSFIEIYNEMIRDLLGDPNRRLEVKMNQEGKLFVPHLTSIEVSNLAEVNKAFAVGRTNRVTASTNMNEHSSRSHALLTVNVCGVNKTTGVKSLGRLNLVDLAGSERVSKSGADGARLKEAQNINKSLSCLGDVIHALKNKQGHVPYRNSKLTYLLQDSLGGDSKTLMIVQVASVEKNVAETLCSLNFGLRARTVELGMPVKKSVRL